MDVAHMVVSRTNRPTLSMTSIVTHMRQLNRCSTLVNDEPTHRLGGRNEQQQYEAETQYCVKM
jgi:hypothetical protein